MYLKYEGADFKIGVKGSLERLLVKRAIQKRIGRWIGKPYRKDPYLDFAGELLSNFQSGVVIDVGANIGMTVLPLAVKFNAAKFYAVEPHPVPAARFINNCERNRVKNVNFLSVAIGLEDRMAQIFTCPTNSGGHRLTGFSGRKDVEKFRSFGPISVPMKPLGEIINQLKISHCDLLKIDTEGYEIFVLESLRNTLHPDKIKYVIAEFGPEGLRQTGRSGWDLISLMLNRGYSCRVLGSDKYIENELQMPQLPDFTAIDLLFSST